MTQIAEQQRKKTRTWGAFEDQRLIAAVTRFGVDNWSRIASFVGNGRTRAQCAQRWNRGLNPRISRDHWSVEEENKLIALIENQQGKGWTQIANEMGNRSDVQCRYRYLQLKKDGKIPPFSGDGFQSPGHQSLEPHSLDYIEKSRYAYSPEPFLSKPGVDMAQPPNSAVPSINDSSPFSASCGRSADSLDETPPPTTTKQAFDFFNIPPPQYVADPWMETWMENPTQQTFEKTDDSAFPMGKINDLNSSMYTLW